MRIKQSHSCPKNQPIEQTHLVSWPNPKNLSVSVHQESISSGLVTVSLGPKRNRQQDGGVNGQPSILLGKPMQAVSTASTAASPEDCDLTAYISAPTAELEKEKARPPLSRSVKYNRSMQKGPRSQSCTSELPRRYAEFVLAAPLVGITLEVWLWNFSVASTFDCV